MTKPRKTDAGLWAVDVDGQTYEWERWGAEEALDVLAEIVDLAGKPIGALLEARQREASGGQGTGQDVVAGKIIASLARKLKRNKKDAIAVLRRLASGKGVFCDGKRVDFNEHYENRLGHLFSVARAAVEVQYGSFFSAALGVWQPNAAGPSTKAAAQEETTLN